MNPLRTPLPALLILAASLAAPGCRGTSNTLKTRQALPFVVRLMTVEVPDVETEIARNPEIKVPANYGDAEEFTRELARSLEDAGAFELVVTEDENWPNPDLEMVVKLQGHDFGSGSVKY